MCHGNWKTYFALVAAAVVLVWALGMNPGYLLAFALCPLMMLVMVNVMDGMGHGQHAKQQMRGRGDRPIQHR